jgi:hypothetical protein
VRKAYTKAVLTAAMVAALGAATGRAEGISADERAKVVKYLTTMRDQVVSESAKLSDAQWNFKASPERWSVGEVVEHLALSEELIFGMQQKTAMGSEATTEQRAATKGKDEVIVQKIPDRTQKAQAPELLRPGQKLGARAEVLKAFQERRAKTLAYAQSTNDDLRSRVSESPMGPVDAYQWLLFIAAHNERHLAQLREVKANPQFPKM